MMNPRLHRTVRDARLGLLLGLIMGLGNPGARAATPRARGSAGAGAQRPAHPAVQPRHAAAEAAGTAGNPEAQYLLGLMYLNGVGIAADPARSRALLQSAAEHGQGAAAYVLASELARDPARTARGGAALAGTLGAAGLRACRRGVEGRRRTARP